jgi:hypothetical protein
MLLAHRRTFAVYVRAQTAETIRGLDIESGDSRMTFEEPELSPGHLQSVVPFASPQSSHLEESAMLETVIESRQLRFE